MTEYIFIVKRSRRVTCVQLTNIHNLYTNETVVYFNI